MIKPAAFFGSYVDAKFMRGLKVTRIMIDIPIEKTNEFLASFGAPDGVNPVPVAVARLVSAPSGAEGTTDGPGAGPQHVRGLPSDTVAVNDRDKPRTPFKDLKRSAQAAMKCLDVDFQNWIIGKYDTQALGVNEVRADETLKRLLKITSKRELDTNEAAGKLWDHLYTEFSVKDYVR